MKVGALSVRVRVHRQLGTVVPLGRLTEERWSFERLLLDYGASPGKGVGSVNENRNYDSVWMLIR